MPHCLLSWQQLKCCCHCSGYSSGRSRGGGGGYGRSGGGGGRSYGGNRYEPCAVSRIFVIALQELAYGHTPGCCLRRLTLLSQESVNLCFLFLVVLSAEHCLSSPSFLMYCHAVKLTAWYIAHHLTAFCFVFHCLHAQTALMPDAVLNLSLNLPGLSSTILGFSLL